MRIGIFLACLLLVAAAFAPAQDLQAVGRGHAIYLVQCMPCHGADARGAGVPTAAVHKPVPDLTRIADRDGSFQPVHVIVHISGERAESQDRDMLRFHRAFLTRGTEASAAINVYCLMRYLEAIQGGVPMAAELPEKR